MLVLQMDIMYLLKNGGKVLDICLLGGFSLGFEDRLNEEIARRIYLLNTTYVFMGGRNYTWLLFQAFQLFHLIFYQAQFIFVPIFVFF